MNKFKVVLVVSTDSSLKEVEDHFPKSVLLDVEANNPSGWGELEVELIKVEPA